MPPYPYPPVRAAAAVVPGPGRTVTFVMNNRGVHAGHWLLPGGRIEEGESAEQAARREAAEEAGVRTGALAPTGVYEVRGRVGEDPYWYWLHSFRCLRPCPVPDGFAPDPAEVSAIRQTHPHDVLPHPVHMRILNDTGLADYDPGLVRNLLSADGVSLRPLDAAPGG